ncbi:peptidylprolyl isomerase [Saccharopolyspora kobensis]|uniref:Peptidyl-prolyl cis-trans isomerase n=1 Tax=Saccharopolyspora kobensis TaxID=146035 RepID=A0A1H5U014_9PSEU|nr:FKBP-type peptidyl-prolyl cis-trans isomerase [Saccharopolyspora kobensis]SEF67778.1 peptidylprolyl isomerase [Saccharopolyspora kobensis]SFC40829.1 peptidylprolyl isomerase [Saccharopolyspora kobensis]
MNTEKPKIAKPTGEPPTELVVKDITVGEGKEATAGTVVAVHYVGVSHSTGKQFDASWDRGEPLQITLGKGQVIEGWDQGLQGMRVGGRRQLVIPPQMAYGDRGAGGVIAPGETLVFVCDLVAAR